MNCNKINIIYGEIYKDDRGEIYSANAFSFAKIKRFYFLHHSDKDIIRGWNGHKKEEKWFYCVQGSFILGLVEIDNWETPSLDLPAQIFTLSREESKIINVPGGFANCIKAKEDNSILAVYSGITFAEGRDDSWKYDKSFWVDWSKF